jgi:hypothetical protein
MFTSRLALIADIKAIWNDSSALLRFIRLQRFIITGSAAPLSAITLSHMWCFRITSESTTHIDVQHLHVVVVLCLWTMLFLVSILVFLVFGFAHNDCFSNTYTMTNAWTLEQANNGKFNFTKEDKAGEYIDWFLWEKPLLVEQRCSEPSAMDAELQLKADISKITVLLPRHRYRDGPSYLLEITTPITPRRLIDEVYSFYQEAIRLQDIHADEDDDYSKDARKRLSKGETVKRVELLGAEDHDGGPGLHRHPFLCSGLVRFEGLKAVQKTAFELILGS